MIDLEVVGHGFNYGLARLLVLPLPEPRRRALLAFGVAVNLLVLAFFKYMNFFLANLEALLGQELMTLHVILPLGISFITFQKIAYLVDVWRDRPRPYAFLDHCLFVTFFPQLSAGPIVHHKELTPQLARPGFGRLELDGFNRGLVEFIDMPRTERVDYFLYRMRVDLEGVAWPDDLVAQVTEVEGLARARGVTLSFMVPPVHPQARALFRTEFADRYQLYRAFLAGRCVLDVEARAADRWTAAKFSDAVHLKHEHRHEFPKGFAAAHRQTCEPTRSGPAVAARP